ncbi:MULTISPECIES: ATP-dependent RNA helicase HrpA [Deefgea]|uniref:ATP-dependent RNA helicase HrpA n=1 Tax=Deefgea chitinilytica TaxID=570276 RepID=A0ABS2C7V1_9NEIS|nr:MULTISPECIES: ATP-dependent RNA helicase HrpA [Deefgea]MBM5570229.1 ATP-dependent RNA helicase HrpA [Deefgea chitinilytica]MBM9887458.1 ATP-dependent RNA helicase HrpA [Deefgea sp. CFH1-16]
MNLDFRALRAQLADCQSADYHSLSRLLLQCHERQKKQQDFAQQHADLLAGIAKSQAKTALRREKLPIPDYDDNLPVNQRRDELKAAIAKHQVVIVCGETGSGKTTQLPKICLELGRGVHGLIGHTQPRRLAARSVASRIAQELKTEMGSAVGYKVRFTEKSSPASYIKLMTDGILLAETLSDRFLNQYDTIIIDEAHERSLNIDFLLGYLKQLLPRRPDLKVIVTSATIDSDRFSKHFNNAPVLEVSGRTFPVEVRYKELSSSDEDDQEIEMEEAIAQAVDELWRKDGSGDVLVFLPGEREIRETAEELRKAKLRDAEILPLFARLSNEDQQRIFRPSSTGRRIVLATNVAETSLTVPGIRYVIDSGQARINRYSPRAKVEQLLIEKISKASARQRAGRCGRVASGICVRLYSEQDFNLRAEFTDPEITRSSLAGVILRMAALKLGNVNDFPFLEAPSSKLISDGYQQLRELGAVNDNDTLTDIGRQLARLPVDPRVGRMLIAGRDEGCLKEMLIITSGLSLQDPRERPYEARAAADQAHAKFNEEKSDFLSYLRLWEFFEKLLADKTSNRQLVQDCHRNFLSYLRLREWRELHKQLSDMVISEEAADSRHRHAPFRLNEKPATFEQIHKALITGLLGNLGFKQPENDEYLGARGIKFNVFPGSSLKKARPKWIVAAELVETSKLYARCVAAIEPEWIEKIAPHLIKKQYFDPHWSKDNAQVNASLRITLYGLPIVARRTVHYGSINPAEAREMFIREALVRFNYNSKAKFFEHNFAMLLDVEELEHKTRRQDVLVDENALFAFFDAIIPHDIVNGAGFEAWRKGAEKLKPQLLFLQKDDLMQHNAAAVTEEQYPEFIRVHDIKLPLSYRFEPGHVLDGVTMTLPLHLLNRVNHATFDWLVPGLIREKITLLIKSLPKSIRRLCVPVPEFATKMLIALDTASREEPLLPQLAQATTRGVGQPVSADEFSQTDLPLHLRMNFRVVDDAGQELAQGRDLIAIRAQLGEAAQLTFRDTADETTGIEKSGITKWDFGDLPAKINFKRHGKSMTGYPGLVPDEDEAGKECVAIRLFDTEHAANEAHRAGVVRLLQFELKEHLKQLPKALPNFNQLAIHYRSLGNSDELMADVIACICNRAFLGDDEAPRKKKDFDEQKSRAKVRLPSVRDAVLRTLNDIAPDFVALGTLLAKGGNIQNELKAQLGELIYKGFLTATPWEQLPRVPVYIKAMKVRLEKRAQNPNRDGQRGAEVAELMQRYLTEIDKWQREGRDTSTLLPFRWMIEELRVGLFAQELRTPYPVSVKRLDKIWGEITKR